MDCQKCRYSDADPVVMRQAKEILFMSTFQRFSCHCGFELNPLLENIDEISLFEWNFFFYLLRLLVAIPFVPIYLIAIVIFHIVYTIAHSILPKALLPIKIETMSKKKALLLSSITFFFIFFVLPACLLPLFIVSKKHVGKFCI